MSWPTQNNRRSFAEGVRRCAPVAIGAVPFGAAAGLAADAAGLPTWMAIGMSSILFAGASQLAALDLAASGAPAIVIVLVVVVINLRFAMYSAALSQWIRPRGWPGRVAVAYLLTDQAFAVTSFAVAPSADEKPREKRSITLFYVGAGLTLWVAWQTGTVLGVLLGAAVPPEAGLEFAAPLAFVALGVGAIRDRSALIAALVALVSFAVLNSLPFGLGLIPSVTLGLAAGFFAGRQAAVAKS